MTTSDKESRNPFVEFQVIVLAGGIGSRLESLVSKKSKAMLSVANKPLIFYTIQNLINHHFGDIIVVVQEKDNECITAYINNEFLSRNDEQNKLNIRVLSLPKNSKKKLKQKNKNEEKEEKDDKEEIGGENAEEIGTAEVLFFCKDYIHTDFFVISCDVVGFVDLYALANLYRVQDCCCAILYIENDALKTQLKTAKQTSNKQIQKKADVEGNPSWIAYDENSYRVLAVKDGISMSHGEDYHIFKLQLFHNSNAVLTKELLDVHVYVFKHSVLNTFYFHQNKILDISSIRFDLVPLLVTLQNTEAANIWACSRLDCNVFASLLQKMNPLLDSQKENKNEKKTENENENLSNFDFKRFLKSSKSYTIANPPPLPKKGGSVICHIQPLASGLTCRVNNLHHYHQINMQFCRPKREELQSIMPAWMIPPFSQNQPSSMRDSVIAEGGVFENNVVVKKSVIGLNVKLESGVRISNCVLMNNVHVCKNSILQHSILSDNVTIDHSCKLSSCVVEEDYRVPPNTKAENENLPSSNLLMEFS